MIDNRMVSRVILGLTDPKIQARHKCDNPPCCNPAHLEPGTAQDNADDQTKRGRRPCGEQRPDAKLTDAEVLAIRRDPRPYRVIAENYGVCRGLIGSVKDGKKWAHLPMEGTVRRRSNNSPEVTEKQLEILQLAGTGMSESAIAKHLAIQTSGVVEQLKSARRKLSVETTEEAAERARQLGLLPVGAA
jgi:DNA-binding CsgD family transcriptional regulator